MRICLTIAYDGRPFAGWQSQSGGNTVQDHIEAALQRILKSDRIALHGSGRTDTGVHALGQVAHFDAPEDCRMDAAAWQRALNVHLPAAIRVMEAQPAAADFHARFQATGKTYRYRLWLDEVLPPLEAGLAWHLPRALNFAFLDAACRLCEGTHDFAAFAANRGDGKDTGRDTVRQLWSVRAEHTAPLLTITFHGSGFLYKMVRMLTGSIVRAALERTPLAWLEKLLAAPGSEKTQHTAPSDGLYLVSVDYPKM